MNDPGVAGPELERSDVAGGRQRNGKTGLGPWSGVWWRGPSYGRVGMVGSSHGAIVQQVAALYRPPHLAAIWPDVGPTNIHAHEARAHIERSGPGSLTLEISQHRSVSVDHAHDFDSTTGRKGNVRDTIRFGYLG